MQLENIPKSEQADVISAYWMMMRELEEKARSGGSPFDKHQVEGYYKIWNRMTSDDKVPYWVSNPMNGAKKWHKANGAAFATGERWVGSGNISVTIVSVRAYVEDPKHVSDWGVTYAWKERGEVVTHEKDAWNFQVRHQYEADLNLKVTKSRSS